MAKRLSTIALAAALTLVAASPAAAAGASSALSPRGMRVQQLELAASGARSAIVMAGYSGTTTRKLRWQLLAKLSDQPRQRFGGVAFAPQIAVGDDGTAIVAWVAGRSLRAAIAPPGHGFGHPQTVVTAPSSVGIVPGGIAVGGRGAGLVAWRYREGPDGVVQVAFRSGNGFTAPQTLGDSFYAPAVARAADGAFVVAWQTRAQMPPPGVPPTLDGNPRVMLAVAAAGASAFGAPTVLAGPPNFLVTPPSAFSGPGGAAVAWQEMSARRIAIVGRAGAVDVTDLGPGRSNDAGYDTAASIATPSGAGAVAVWRFVTTSAERIVGTQVLAAQRAPGGVFAAPQALSSARRFAGAPVVAAAGGKTIVAWSERAPRGGARLRVRVLDGGVWSAPTTIATADASGPVRLASAGRSAVVAWVARTGRARGRVYVYEVPAR